MFQPVDLNEPRFLVGYPCPQCDGEGRVPASPLTLSIPQPQSVKECAACGGTGNRREQWIGLNQLKQLLEK